VRALNLWLHVLGFAVYLGSTIALVVGGLPIVTEMEDPVARRRLLARTMRVYNPLSLGALGVAIMTGAFNLTDYKASLGPRFFAEVGAPLAWKLLTVFALVMTATGLSFGIGHRTVREELGGEPVDAAAIEKRLRRLPWMLWAAIALVAIAIWLGLRMSH
jgi:uncharacterized membrane protein